MRGDLAAVTWNYNGIIVTWNYNGITVTWNYNGIIQKHCNGPRVQIRKEIVKTVKLIGLRNF